MIARAKREPGEFIAGQASFCGISLYVVTAAHEVDRDHAVGTVCRVEAAVPSLASETPPDDDLSLMPLKVYPMG